MPIQLTGQQAKLAREAVSDLKSHLSFIQNAIGTNLGQYAGMPRALSNFMGSITELEKLAWMGSKIDAPIDLEDHWASTLAATIMHFRRQFVRRLEDYRARAVASELLRNLDDAKLQLDQLFEAPWYADAETERLPRLRDFIAPVPDISMRPPMPPPVYDDKFGILLSASSILSDLRDARAECEERYVPVSVAFVDVDGLKALNTQLGETWVDSLVLPPLMRVVEGASYGHGHAYRYGGDEFVLLFPSATQAVAQVLLERLQRDLRELVVEQLDSSPTVSVGLCVVHPDAPITDREALHWAALAKRHAKGQRNSIAVTVASRAISPPHAHWAVYLSGLHGVLVVASIDEVPDR